MCADCKPEKKSQILHIRPYPEQGENGLPKRKPGLYQDSEPFEPFGQTGDRSLGKSQAWILSHHWKPHTKALCKFKLFT